LPKRDGTLRTTFCTAGKINFLAAMENMTMHAAARLERRRKEMSQQELPSSFLPDFHVTK
jgi:hypothetical protein